MKSWIKGGIIGAVLYTIANILSLFLALCGFSSTAPSCKLAGWIYGLAFPGGFISHVLFPLFGLKPGSAGIGLFLAADIIVGFAIGALIVKGVQKLRRR